MNNFNIEQVIDRNIYLYGDINDMSALDVISKINLINEYDYMEEEDFISGVNSLIEEGLLDERSLKGLRARDPITLEINSSGGSSSAGFAIITAIQNSETPIVGRVSGNCMSMAIPIIASCDYRVASEYSKFMIHDIYSASEGKFNDLNSSLDYVSSVRNDYIEVTSKYTKMSKEEVEEISNRNSDYFFSSEKAFELGLVDSIDGDKVDEEDMLNKLYGPHEVEGAPDEEDSETGDDRKVSEKQLTVESDTNPLDELIEEHKEESSKKKYGESPTIDIKASDLEGYSASIRKNESTPFNTTPRRGTRYFVDEHGEVNMVIDKGATEDAGFISRAIKSISDMLRS